MEKLKLLVAHRLRLSNENRNYLEAILRRVGRASANLDFAITNVETVLSSYAVLAHLHSNIARASTIAGEARELVEVTRRLLAVLRKAHTVTLDEVTQFTDECLQGTRRGLFPDPHSPNDRWWQPLTDMLTKVEEGSIAVVAHYRSLESRGGRQNLALHEVVGRLCDVFDSFYLRRKGSLPKRLDPDRVEFVLVALQAGNIPHPDDERLTRDYLPKPDDN